MKLTRTTWQTSISLACFALTAHAADYPLYAGKNIPAGTLSITGTNPLLVSYTLNQGFCMTESHLAIAANANGIPQKNGNPIPGQFPNKRSYNPCVTSDSYVVTPSGNGPYYIAAHAVVQLLTGCTSNTIVSTAGSQTVVTARRSGNQVGFTPVANAPVALAYAPAVWMAVSDNNAVLGGSGAKWIWESTNVQDPVFGTVLDLKTDFNVPGLPVNGALTLTCDNGFKVSLNNMLLGSENVVNGFENSDLHEPSVHANGWQTIPTFPLAGKIKTGLNTLLITGANEYQNTDDTPADPLLGTQLSNPGGCIFAVKFDSCSSVKSSETAWAGTNGFSGSNWATYVIYPF